MHFQTPSLSIGYHVLLFLPVPSVPSALGHVRQAVLEAGADVGQAVAHRATNAASGAVDGLAESASCTACWCIDHDSQLAAPMCRVGCVEAQGQGYVPTTPPTVLDKPETVLPRIPVTVLAAPVTPLLLSLFILMVCFVYSGFV